MRKPDWGQLTLISIVKTLITFLTYSFMPACTKFTSSIQFFEITLIISFDVVELIF